MAKLLNLHRAARLVGVTRGALQKKIQDGELDAFDGMVALEALHNVYPEATLENDLMLEETALIKEHAFGRRVVDHTLPDKEVLAARLHELSKELVETKSLLKHARSMLEGMQELLGEWVLRGGDQARWAAGMKDWLHQQRMQLPVTSEAAQALMVRDNFLRVMAAQVKVLPSGADFFVEGGDTLLEAALRAGVAVPYGCSNTSCGLCKTRLISGEIKQIRPQDYILPPTQREQGYVLMCACTAVSDLVVEAPVARSASEISDQTLSGAVQALTHPTDEVLVIHIKTSAAQRLRFLAGQRAVLTLSGSLAAELPIASCPCEDRHLEFHVRRMHGHHFSDYAFDQLRVGDTVTLRGPRGDFVLDTESARPIVFIVFCTGFAPVKSLMEHALALDQAEAMHLIWVAAKPSGLYLSGLARSWADALDNFYYEPIIVGGDLDATASRQETIIQKIVVPKVFAISGLSRAQVYIAGPALAVGTMKKILVERVAEEQIFTDYE